jgi:hypothetical protein
MLKIFFILAGFIFTTPIFAQSWTDPSRTVLWVKVDSEGTLELKFADLIHHKAQVAHAMSLWLHNLFSRVRHQTPILDAFPASASMKSTS